jgi:hypothetical protein
MNICNTYIYTHSYLYIFVHLQVLTVTIFIHADGFKCDGTDPYILEYSLAGGAYGYNNQLLTYRDYADAYYRDFLLYTRQKRGGDNGLIMSRPVVSTYTKSYIHVRTYIESLVVSHHIQHITNSTPKHTYIYTQYSNNQPY